MKRNVIERNVEKAKSNVKQRRGKPNDDRLELDMVFVARDQLIDSIEECYGIARDEAERQVTDWEAHEAFDEDTPRARRNIDAALH